MSGRHTISLDTSVDTPVGRTTYPIVPTIPVPTRSNNPCVRIGRPSTFRRPSQSKGQRPRLGSYFVHRSLYLMLTRTGPLTTFIPTQRPIKRRRSLTLCRHSSIHVPCCCNSSLITLASTGTRVRIPLSLASLPHRFPVQNIGWRTRKNGTFEKESDYAPTTQNLIELTNPLDHRLLKFCVWRVLYGLITSDNCQMTFTLWFNSNLITSENHDDCST